MAKKSRQGQFPIRRDETSGRYEKMHPEESPFDLRHLSDPEHVMVHGVDWRDNVLCGACGWHGERGLLLSATNPFRDGLLYACPVCRQIESVALRCAHKGCLAPATLATPNGHAMGEGVMVCLSHWHPPFQEHRG